MHQKAFLGFLVSEFVCVYVCVSVCRMQEYEL